jgi:dihydropteroate synthase
MKYSDLEATKCGNSVFNWKECTYIMGIINLSRDSFSGDGCFSVKDALERAQNMVKEGADIIDVGAESTRPNSEPVSFEEETENLIPFINEAAKTLSVPISVDTYKYTVAVKALDAGAHMINDVSALKHDPDLVKLAAERYVPIIVTSNDRGTKVNSLVEEVIDHLRKLVDSALNAGVPRSKILIDPGIGFGKTKDQNLQLINRLDELSIIKQPILLGTSRKSFIGLVLDADIDNRVDGTAATVAIGIARGANMVRVHDVKVMSRICRMSDAIIRGS